jgi:arginine decarboxylase
VIGRGDPSVRSRALVVDDELGRPDTARGRSVRTLALELKARGVEVVEALSYDDALANVVSDASIHCVLLDWTLGRNDTRSHEHATRLLRTIRRRNEKVPVFLMADRTLARSLTAEVMELADEFIWALEDTADFIAGRVIAAMDRYFDALLPPFAAALLKYDREREYPGPLPATRAALGSRSPRSGVFSSTFSARTSSARTWESSAPS